MRLYDEYHGGEAPFEGDLALVLRGMPANALVNKASVTVTPVKPASGKLFEETFTFTDNKGPFGATKIANNEIDFHARRTLAQATATAITAAQLHVDVGAGIYVQVTKTGAFKDPGTQPTDLQVSLNPLPSLSVTKFKLDNTPTPTISSVVVRSTPTNVSVRLGQLAPFWTYLGEMAEPQTSTDFAEVVKAFLTKAKAQDGFFALPLVIHSDTIARLHVAVAIEYVIEQPILPPHLPEITVPHNFSTLPGLDDKLTTVKLPRGAVPVDAGAQIQGQYEATRIAAGPIGEAPPKVSVEVSSDCSLAQAIRFQKEIAVTGVDLPLGKTGPGLAGMNVSIQEDNDGKPSGTKLASAEVVVGKPLPGQTVWGSATLPSPFRVLPGERYWLILQSRVGKAYWDAITGIGDEPALQCSRDGGLSWRQAGAPQITDALEALFRLRDTPEQFTVPVQLQIGKGPAAVHRKLDEFAPLGRIEFAFDFAQKLQEHLAKPEVGISPCGPEELIENGRFERPPLDVATRRLFGFDRGSGVWLGGRVDLSQAVDLSVERYLYLSYGTSAVIRIDCAGRTSARTTLDEIVTAINRATRSFAPGQEVARGDPQTGNRLVLQSPNIQTSGAAQPLTLHFGATHAPPGGWQAIGGVQRVRWPPEIGTTWDEGMPAPAPIGGPIACALHAEPGAIEATALSQQLAVTESCAYALRFLFQSNLQVGGSVDFRNYQPTDAGPNPRTEGDARFESWSSGTPPTQNANTVINDWDQGNGLEVADGELRIFVPRSAVVELTLQIGGNVNITALNEDGSVAQSLWASEDATIALTGAAITQVNLSASSGANQALIYRFTHGRSPANSALRDAWGALGLEFGTPSSADAAHPRWEVTWSDNTGRQIRVDGADLDTMLTRNVDGLLAYETLLTAPAGATHADVRFAQPPQGLFVLGDVSLSPTVVVLSNGAFHEWTVQGEQLLPVGWTRKSGAIERVMSSPSSPFLEGVRLKSGSAEDSVLIQTASVKGGRGYGLTARVWLERPAVSSTTGTTALSMSQRPRVELVWMDATGKSIDPAVILPLDEPGFLSYFWHGTAPESAVQIGIHLIQPRDGVSHLVIGSLSFEGDDLVEVPLIFLGEAPGQLTVSNMHVTYDLPTPPQHAMRLAQQRQITGSQGIPRGVGTAVRATPAAVVPLRLSLADSPMDMVSGVGTRFAKILRALSPPISTVAGLAALDPQVKIKGISAGRQLELKTAAEMISDIDLTLPPTSTLADETLDILLALPVVELAQRGALSIKQAEQLKRKLRALRLLIKDDAFRRLRPSDLMAG